MSRIPSTVSAPIIGLLNKTGSGTQRPIPAAAASLKDALVASGAVRRLLRLYRVLGDTERLKMWNSLCHRTPIDVRNDLIYQLKRLECPGQVVGAAYLLGVLYVILENSPELLVYVGRGPYALKNSVIQQGMKPVDICSSYRDMCVYILDDIGPNKCVWRVTADQSEYSVIWSQIDLGRIMVAEHKIVTAFGAPSERYTLPVAAGNFSHATEITEDELLICQETEISRISKSDQTVRRPTRTDNGGNYMTVTVNDDIIISDHTNNQVVLLDSSTLEKKDVLLTLERDGIESPCHVHYVGENGLLLVSWLNYVDVYSFIETDTSSHLAATEEDIREQQTREVYFLETQIAESEAFVEMKKVLLGLQPDDSIRHWKPRPSTSAASRPSDVDDEDSVPCVQENLEEICSWLARQEWNTRFYHDLKDGRVHIAVDITRREEAEECIERSYSRLSYVFEDSRAYRFQYCADRPTVRRTESCRPLASPTLDLQPGKIIYFPNGTYCLFSGSLSGIRKGITVAHAVARNNPVTVDEGGTMMVIGKCSHRFETLTLETRDSLTADLALLEIDDLVCTVENFISWPNLWGRKIHTKIYKSDQVPDDTKIMVLDQNGRYLMGSIRQRLLTDKSLADRGFHNVLAIGVENSANSTRRVQAITQLGDSGALVMSCPAPSQDYVHVYGIVSGIVEDEDFSLTIANSLWKVLRAAARSDSIKVMLDNNSLSVEDIDFE